MQVVRQGIDIAIADAMHHAIHRGVRA